MKRTNKVTEEEALRNTMRAVIAREWKDIEHWRVRSPGKDGPHVADKHRRDAINWFLRDPDCRVVCDMAGQNYEEWRRKVIALVERQDANNHGTGR